MPGRRWADAERDTLLTYAGTESLVKIGERIGRTEAACKQKLQTFGVQAADAQGLLTAELAAREYGFGYNTVRRWVAKGKVKAHRGPRYWQIDPYDLERFLEHRAGA